MLEDQARVLMLALENRTHAQNPCNHPIMGWILEHAATRLTNCHVGRDGLTTHERVHGQCARDRLAERGEVVFYDVPVKQRANFAATLQVCMFVSRP